MNKFDKKSTINFMRIYLLLIMLFLSLTMLNAQRQTYFVNYGPEAPANSGDYYHQQFIHFKVPASYSGELFVRLYDISCGGEYDSQYGEECSKFEVTLFSDFIDENEFPNGLNYVDVSGKSKITSKIFADETEYFNRWYTFSKIDLSKTNLKDGFRYFSLLVKAISGNDANGFDVFLSSSKDDNKNIDRAEIFCFEPTIRFQKRAERYTFRVKTEQNEFTYVVKNFDFDNIDLGYSTFLKKFTIIYGSDDGKWNSPRFTLNKFEVGKDVGITIGPNYSSKIENDLVFSVQNSFGKKLPIQYPPQLYFEEIFPVLNSEIIYLNDCRTAELRVDKSTDINNRELIAEWIYEDDTIDEGLVVQKTFSSTGKFSPSVLLYNTSNDITRAVLKKLDVTINKSPKAIAGENKIAALNETILFDASNSSDEDGRIISYKWDFGDGNIASGIRTTHSYSSPGIYNVKLTVEDNFSASPCRFDETFIKVIVNSKPIAVTTEQLIGSTGEVISFNAEKSFDSDGKIIRYVWDFGKYGKKEGAIVTHTFDSPGIYNVKLTVTDNSTAKNESDFKNITVKINYPPESIPGNNILAAIGEIINFNGSKSYDKDGEIIKYEWDFGDGNKSVGQITSHSYNKSGVYTVKLNVTDNSGTLSASSESSISVRINEPPVAIAGENIFSNSGFISFDASSSYDSDGKITKYFWDFGDGKKGEGINISHTYQQSGIYNVELTVKDNTEALNNKSSVSIKVNINSKPSAAKLKNITVAPGEVFRLSAKDSFDPDRKIIEYKWMLGNEIISTAQSFDYSILNPGKYQITLSVKDDFVHPAYDFSSIYVVVNNSPTPIISAPKAAPINSIIKFDASRSFDFEGSIIEYNWDFGDGTTSKEKTTNKIYDKPGNYTVKLSVRDEQNVSNSIAEISTNIFINSKPIAKTTTNITTCDKNIVFDASLSADPDGDPITCYWNFFDGTEFKKGVTVKYNFEKTGIYPVLLIVDDNNGLSNSRDSISILVTINAPPVAVIGNDTTICSGDFLILNGLSSFDPEGGTLKYEWLFDDGTMLEGATINKFWKKSGVYQVTLKVTDNSGLPCNISYASKLIRVYDSPVADAGEDIFTCVNTPVYFDGSKSTDIDGIVNAYDWDFGDGEMGNGVKPVHTYKNPGQYRVTLIVTGNSNGNCDNKAFDDLIVNVNQGPSAYFTSVDSVALGSSISFDASESKTFNGRIISYNWDFGNEETANGVRVNHQFNNNGNYKVTLTIKTDSETECNTTSFSKNIFVNNPPVASFKVVNEAGVNSIITMDASKSNDIDGNISKYEWNLGDGIIKYGKIINHSYSKGGKYEIVLTVYDNTNLPNNSSSDKMFIFINDAPIAEIESKEKIYEGDEIELTSVNAKDSEGDELFYSWFINNKQIESAAERIKYKFYFPGSYNVKLIVKDNSGFENNFSVINKFITVLPLPKLFIGRDTTICEGTMLEISPIIDGKLHSSVSSEWFVNNELVSSSETLKFMFTNAGDYKVTLKIFDKLNHNGVLALSEINVRVNKPISPAATEDFSESIGYINDDIIFDAGKYFNYSDKEYSFIWDLGNGIILHGEKVVYKFTKTGTYNITLKVDDNQKTKCSVYTTKFKLRLNNK